MEIGIEVNRIVDHPNERRILNVSFKNERAVNEDSDGIVISVVDEDVLVDQKHISVDKKGVLETNDIVHVFGVSI